MRPNVTAVWAALVSLPLAACAGWEQWVGAAGVTPPTVSFEGATLARAPSRQTVAAYACPSALRAQANLGAAAEIVCRGLFGARPAREQMALGVDLRFVVDNPNRVPLPLTELLTAITVFPGSGSQKLGATCVRLCAEGDAACAAGRNDQGCRDTKGTIKSLDDVPGAALELLRGLGVAAAAGEPISFSAPRVSAGARLPITARLEIAPEAVVPALERLAAQWADELRAGRTFELAIPYEIEGTVFADAGSLPRVAAGYGPLEGAWALVDGR